MLGCTRPIVIPMATVVVMVTSMILHHTTNMQQENMSHKLKIIQIPLVGINQKVIVQLVQETCYMLVISCVTLQARSDKSKRK